MINAWSAQAPTTDFGPTGSEFSTLLPRAPTLVLAPARHFTAFRLCKPDGAAILREERDDPVCDDPQGTDRHAVHRRIIDRIAEHQSAPVPRMAARMMAQTGMLYESLTPRARDAAGRLPPLLAVVVYTGDGEWHAATDLAELAGASGDGDAGAGAMAQLAGRRYVVLDSRRLAREHPPERNRMTVFVRLTFLASVFEAWEVLAGAREWLDLADEEERSLYQCYVDWLGALAPEHRPESWDPERTRRMEELMEEVTTFQRNTERAIERYRQEGVELEKARSAERERSLLARQASLRFGAAVGRRLGAWLADVSDPAVFDKVGDLIVGCATGEELLNGIDETPA